MALQDAEFCVEFRFVIEKWPEFLVEASTMFWVKCEASEKFVETFLD